MKNDLLDQSLEHARHACGLLYSDKCCHKLIDELDYRDPQCAAQFMTKSLGYAIIVGASAVKLPQIFKIYSAKSGAGITLLGVTLELLAITFNAAYSYRNQFPLSAWGEAITLAIETALIALLVMYYGNQRFGALIYLLCYGAITYSLIHPSLINDEYIWYAQSSVLPLALAGKLMQAFKNIRAGHTGQLSALSAWFIFLGSLSRVFTTIQETGDQLTTVTYAAAASANCLLALQVLYYWNATNKHFEAARKRKARD